MPTDFAIPRLSDGAVALSMKLDNMPKNRYGIPQHRLEPRDRQHTDEIDYWIRQVNNHLMDLFRQAALTESNGYLTSLPEYNDPWEQRALILKVGRMNSKKAGVITYPHDPADVLFLHDLVEFLKDLVIKDAQAAKEEHNGAFEPQDPQTDSERIAALEEAVASIIEHFDLRLDFRDAPGK